MDNALLAARVVEETVNVLRNQQIEIQEQTLSLHIPDSILKEAQLQPCAPRKFVREFNRWEGVSIDFWPQSRLVVSKAKETKPPRQMPTDTAIEPVREMRAVTVTPFQGNYIHGGWSCLRHYNFKPLIAHTTRNGPALPGTAKSQTDGFERSNIDPNNLAQRKPTDLKPQACQSLVRRFPRQRSPTETTSIDRRMTEQTGNHSSHPLCGGLGLSIACVSVAQSHA